MGDLEVIAIIHNDLKEKFGIPRQSSLAPSLESRIVFEPKFRVDEALRGLEAFSHIWLIWGFSENEHSGWSPTVRPPRLGGNVRLGVFATRSPFRPNSLGLSCVKLERIQREPGHGSVLIVSGADLMDGTPIYDIKPYLTTVDCHSDARCGFVDDNPHTTLEVELSDDLMAVLSESQQTALREILSQDPRPAYHHDEKREYGMSFGRMNVRFTVCGNIVKARKS